MPLRVWVIWGKLLSLSEFAYRMRTNHMIDTWDHSKDSVRYSEYRPCQGIGHIVSTLLLLILLVTF